eukprot:00074.XXX_1172_2051_1 [CDS] Oithona nana genome sequencing.
MFALPVINYSQNKENCHTTTLDISVKDHKEHITFSSVMSELLQNTTENMEWDEGENRTSSNFVTLEFSTEAKNQKNLRSSNVRFLTQHWEELAQQSSQLNAQLELNTIGDDEIFGTESQNELPDYWFFFVPLLFPLFWIRFSFDALIWILPLYQRFLDTHLIRGLFWIGKIYYSMGIYLLLTLRKLKSLILHWMVWWNSVDFTETKTVLKQCTMGKIKTFLY